jgi:thiopurine S-methyltransferase
LLAQQCRVIGVELSERAVSELWSELGVSPKSSYEGALVHYHAPGLEVFEGDIFALNQAQLGPVDAIYDRAALVALPPEMRRRYAKHLVELSGGAPQLLLS